MMWITPDIPHVQNWHASLKGVLKSEFGITWKGSRKKLGEGPHAAELRKALAEVTDWQMKDRLKALIALAEGGGADAVAHLNGVTLETLRKWARRWGAFGVDSLRGRPRGLMI